MKEKRKEAIESICKTLNKVTPEQEQYIVGLAEGIAYANEKASENREDVPESEKQ